MSHTPPPTDGLHRDIVELLPWYAKGSLSGRDHERVRKHLTGCTACRGELAAEAELAEAVAAPTPLPALDSAAGLAALEERLGPRPETSGVAAVVLWWRSLAAAPASWRFAAAVPTLAALLLAALLVGTGWRRPEPPATATDVGSYTLLTDPPATADGRLWVEVDPQATEGALRALLRALDAQIVAGPTAQGVYTLAVPGGADRAGETAARLAASGLVRSATVAPGP